MAAKNILRKLWTGYRYHGVLLLLAVLSAVTLLDFGNSTASAELTDLTIAPSTPILVSVVYENGHVDLSWQASQPGQHQLSHYHVYRKTNTVDFTEISSVEATTTGFTDDTGNLGDSYKVTAADDQDPANTSPDSDTVLADVVAKSTEQLILPNESLPTADLNIAQSAEDLVGVTPSEAKLPTDSAMLKDILPAQNTKLDSTQINAANHSGDVKLAQLSEAVQARKTDLVGPLLNTYNHDKRQLYKQFPTMRPADKANVKRACVIQNDRLETDLLNLPESYQMSALIALATCHLIEYQP